MMLNLRREATVGLILTTLVGVSVVMGFAAFAGGVAGQEASSGTQAPDLQSVGNFTEGTEGGENYTFVDFTFDQPVEGADSAGNFELVPVDGGPVVDGQNIVDGNATRTVTVAFPTSVSQNDTARGIIQPSTVRVADGTDATSNPLQTAAVSNDGVTDDPDLVNVTINETTNSLVYAFDEPVSVNSDGGFQVYAANTTQYDGSVATDSLATPRLVNVTFNGINVSAVVGAAVTQGTVSNTTNATRTNSPDEVLVSNESAPEFTRCGDGGTADMGDGGNGTGPTVAPDLVDIDNFTYRQNPEDTNCQTLVEFDFDEAVTVQGGAGNFQMVPNDSQNFQNQVFDGNNEIVGTTNNTTSLTVPFDGRIDPEAVVRGFVDKNTVRVAGEGDETANPKQAVDFNNDGNSANPDLVAVSRAGANELRFAFDEPIGEIESTGSFRFYYANATVRNSLDATITNNSSVVVAEYAPKFDAGSGAVGGSVANGAVSGTDTAREDGDTNQFDEVAVGNGIETGIEPVSDFESPPTDVDGDGLSEDINGDGQLTQDDAQALYDNLDDSSVQNNADAFDFNGDGGVTQADAQALYDEWSTSN
jgi:hypothetical protein